MRRASERISSKKFGFDRRKSGFFRKNCLCSDELETKWKLGQFPNILFCCVMNLRPDSSQTSAVNSADVQVDLIRVNQMTPEMETTWRQLCESNPEFSSPYFDLEFIRAVDRVRPDIEIGVLTNQRKVIVGFFPFQRTRPTAAEPAGGRLNDVHGIIGPQSVRFQMLDVLRQSRLAKFSFHALTGSTIDSGKSEFTKTEHLLYRFGIWLGSSINNGLSSIAELSSGNRKRRGRCGERRAIFVSSSIAPARAPWKN